MHRIERRDGMIVEWNAPIAMEDGNVLRCDVFRPLHERPSPVILSYGAFGKGLAFARDSHQTTRHVIHAVAVFLARGAEFRMLKETAAIAQAQQMPERVVGRHAVTSRGRGDSTTSMASWR